MLRTPRSGRAPLAWSSERWRKGALPGAEIAMDVTVEAVNDSSVAEPVRWQGRCKSLEDLKKELSLACGLSKIASVDFLDEAFDEWAEALDVEVIPRCARLRLRGWRLKDPAASRVGSLAESVALAELTLDGDIEGFEAMGGVQKFEEELGALVGAPGRVEVIDLRAGSVVVTFLIHPSEQTSMEGAQTTPANALDHLQKILADAPAKWAKDTQILRRTRPATLQVLEAPAGDGAPVPRVSSQSESVSAAGQVRELELVDASEDEEARDRLVQLTPRAVPTQASAEYRAKGERTYEMMRFYTERAEPMLVQRYRSEEMILRRWYTEHPAGIRRAQQWGSSRPTTDAEWDAKIGEIIDYYLQRADAGQSDRCSPATSGEIQALFVELDRDGRGSLDAAGIAEVSRRVGLELSGRRLEEAVVEMSKGGLTPCDSAEICSDCNSEYRVEWEEFDCWFRLRQAIDGLPYPELMYATYIFEEGVDPRRVCRGDLPNIVSIPPECSYRVKLQASKHPKYDFPHRDQVYKDVPRTFSKHPQFATEELFGSDEICDETGRFRVNWRALPADRLDVECGRAAPSLVQSLQNVLMAIVAHSPNGYTQGMNYVAATLLLHRSEEEAFDWLCRIVDLYPGLYAGNLWGTRVETRAVDALLSETAVGKHMADLGVSSQLFTTAWILPLFCSVMHPSDLTPVTSQVLHHLIALEGRAQNTRLARLSLSLFKMHEARLLATRDAGELMELVPKLPAAFSHTPQGICKRLVGMLALAQSDELVSDAQIVAERSQQRREVAAEARRRKFMQETLAICKKIEQDISRRFDVEELLARIRQHIIVTHHRAERKLKVRDTAQPQMGAVHIVMEEADRTHASYDDGDETTLSLGDSWEAEARSLFADAAVSSKADEGSGIIGRTVTLYEFCAVCEKVYMFLEPAQPAADRSGGAALRPWLSAPSAAELRDIADMENWLVTIGDGVTHTGGAIGDSGETPVPPSNRMVETVEAHPRHHPPDSEFPAVGSGWFTRWRCCVNTSPAAPPPLADAAVLPRPAPGETVRMEPQLQMSESDAVRHQRDEFQAVAATISEGVPPVQ